MISLKKNISILLYEKEKILNSILQYQIINYNNYDVLVIENYEELLEIVINRNFNAYILNLNDLGNNSKNFIKNTSKQKMNISNIIAYHEPFLKKND